jgi:hypothetical protein
MMLNNGEAVCETLSLKYQQHEKIVAVCTIFLITIEEHKTLKTK